MKEFHIAIRSFADAREFVSVAAVQPFRVLVGNDAQLVDAKGFIGMASLDCRKPLKVLCDSDTEGFLAFRDQAGRFLV